MTLWVIFGLLLIIALQFLIWPMYRSSRGLSGLLAGVIIFVVASSAGLYYRIGQPGVPSGAGSTPDINEMVSSLAERLKSNPDDVNGWKMLGRSYQTLKQYDSSIDAYEKAMALEDGQDSQTLVSLALVIAEAGDQTFSGRSGSLLENALALDPNNPNALFYSGFSAASRGDTALAADRWEMLMGLNAPPEIQKLLQQKISEWRGAESLPSTATEPAVEQRGDGLPPVTAPEPVSEQTGAIIIASVSVTNEAAAKLPDNATVYIIARDPAQPSPPVAVARRQLSELPMTVELSDRDSMVPGRNLSGFAEFELLARISVSGQPIAQAGDWFGSLQFRTGEDKAVDLVIDTLVN